MAVVQLNLSRRALLGAAFAAPVLAVVGDAVAQGVGQGPVLSRHPGLDPGSTFSLLPSPTVEQERWMPDQVRHDVDAWDRSKARFGQADAELTALAGGPDDNLYNRAATRHDRALVRLLRTPAPDAAALADKIDLLIAHQAWEFRAADTCLAALAADARCLAEEK